MKKFASPAFRVSIFAAIAFASAFLIHSENLREQYESKYLRNSNYHLQTGMYELSRLRQADIVMLGTSHTFNANWSELLNRKNIANRGINSDILPGFQKRLRYVYRLEPKICFIEGGVNEISEECDAEMVFVHYTQVIDSLRAHAILPVIQSTLFVAREWPNASLMNREIRSLDSLLADYAVARSIPFLDVNSLVTEGGFLRPELTCDGIHLNATGYALWLPLVERVLISHGL
jgi:lysophospholipase L1-like esterase